MIKTDKKLLFVHIPKTGGTSVRIAFKHNNINLKDYIVPDGPRRPEHDPLFILERYNDISQYHTFSIIRNPFTRVFSHYTHFIRIDQIDKNGNKLTSFEQFLDYVRRKRQFIYNHLDPISIANSVNSGPYIVYTQSFFLYNCKGKMGIDKLYRYENLSEIEQDFDIKLPKENEGRYSKEDYYESYNQTNIDLVRHIYLEDFINLGYSTDFS